METPNMGLNSNSFLQSKVLGQQIMLYPCMLLFSSSCAENYTNLLMRLRCTYLVVVMELDRVPLAVTDPPWDVWRHSSLRLTWMTWEGGKKEEESGRQMVNRGRMKGKGE